MNKPIYYSYKDALKKGLIKKGTIVISYPNHKGESLRGEIVAGASQGMVRVDYCQSGKINSQDLFKDTGKYWRGADTSFDINLIEISE